MLRALQVGLSLPDLNLLTFGEVTDLIIERGNDDYKYKQVATQADYDSF